MPTYKELAPRCAKVMPEQILRMNVLIAIDDVAEAMHDGGGAKELAKAAAAVLAHMHQLGHSNWDLRSRCHLAPRVYAGYQAHVCWLLKCLANVGRAMQRCDMKDTGVSLELLLIALEHVYVHVVHPPSPGVRISFPLEIEMALEAMEGGDAA